MRRNVLDSLGCAIAALDGETVRRCATRSKPSAVAPRASLIGGGRTTVDQAALFNSVAVRYLDLLDTYLTPGGLCHPADNFGALLAVAESVGAGGADFLLALAVAYEVQCRFSASVPVMAHGLNHALQLAISVAAGAAKLSGLTAEQTADAIAMAAADNVSLAAIHSEPVSNCKGISPGITAQRAVYVTALAKRGITGPRGIIDGPNGLEQLFDQSIDLRLDDPTLDVVADNPPEEVLRTHSRSGADRDRPGARGGARHRSSRRHRRRRRGVPNRIRHRRRRTTSAARTIRRPRSRPTTT